MKKVKINYKLENFILAEDVVSEDGRLLLVKGCKLRKLDILILINRGIDEIFIMDKELSKIDPEFLEVYNKGLKSVEKIFNQANDDKKIDLEYTYKIFYDIQRNIGSNINIVKQLVALKELDLYTAQHSLNVGILSVVLSNLMELDELDVIKIGYGGLLHDIGKSLIPDDILKKPYKLTDKEFSIIKNHPKYGYDILKKNKIDDEIILSCVLMHHERLNGSGYPMGLKSKDISLAAQIVAIADIFDAITSERVYNGAASIIFAYTELKELAYNEKVNVRVVIKFLERLSDSMEGRKILLSNGSIGKFIKSYPYEPEKSLIEVNGKYIDLNKETTMIIERFLD